MKRKSGRKRTLHSACREGHLGKVRFLLNSGSYTVESSSSDEDNKSPLWVACAENHVSIAQYLIDRGAEVDHMYEVPASREFGKQTLTALGLACRTGSLAVVKLLLSEGANGNKVRKDGYSALMVATEANQIDIIRYLIQHKVDLSVQNDIGSAAIHVAAKQDGLDKEILRLLVQKGGVDVKTMTSDGFTALHIACMHGLYDNALCLMELGASISTLDRHGSTALHWACTSPVFQQPFNHNTNTDLHGPANQKLVAHLVKNQGAQVHIQSNSLGTPLHCACRDYRNTEIIHMLIDYGADVNATDECGFTPLYLAYQLSHMAIVDLLLLGGANVNAHNGYERTTVLHKACFDGDRERIEHFIDAGADLRARNRFRWTVIHFCVRSYQPDWRGTLELILTQIYHALGDVMAQNFINEQDNEKCTALHHACRFGAEAKASMLLDHGACPNIPGYHDGKLCSPAFAALERNFHLIVFLLLRRGALIDSCNGKDDSTLLHYACQQGYSGMIQFLIGEGACLERTCRLGWNAVHYAAAGGHCDGLRLVLDLCCAVRGTRIPEHDMIERKERQGCTPIHLACRNGHFGTAQLLLEKGACPTLSDSVSILPVEKAARVRDYSTTFMILKSMAGRDWFRGRSSQNSKKPKYCAIVENTTDVVAMDTDTEETTDSASLGTDGGHAPTTSNPSENGRPRTEKIEMDRARVFASLDMIEAVEGLSALMKIEGSNESSANPREDTSTDGYSGGGPPGSPPSTSNRNEVFATGGEVVSRFPNDMHFVCGDCNDNYMEEDSAMDPVPLELVWARDVERVWARDETQPQQGPPTRMVWSDRLEHVSARNGTQPQQGPPTRMVWSDGLERVSARDGTEGSSSSSGNPEYSDRKELVQRILLQRIEHAIMESNDSTTTAAPTKHPGEKVTGGNSS